MQIDTSTRLTYFHSIHANGEAIDSLSILWKRVNDLNEWRHSMATPLAFNVSFQIILDLKARWMRDLSMTFVLCRIAKPNIHGSGVAVTCAQRPGTLGTFTRDGFTWKSVTAPKVLRTFTAAALTQTLTPSEDTNDVPKIYIVIILLRNMEFNRITNNSYERRARGVVATRMWIRIWQKVFGSHISPSRNYQICGIRRVRRTHSLLKCTSRERGLANRSFMGSRRGSFAWWQPGRCRCCAPTTWYAYLRSACNRHCSRRAKIFYYCTRAAHRVPQ